MTVLGTTDMQTLDARGYIAVNDFMVLVPPTLADFECDHGRIGVCPECAAAERDPANEVENT